MQEENKKTQEISQEMVEKFIKKVIELEKENIYSSKAQIKEEIIKYIKGIIK